MSDTVSFNEDTYIKNEPVIIYGASVYGELAYIALKQMGCMPDYYCDQSNDRKEYLGIRVMHPKELAPYKGANIIIASADFFYEIKRELEEIGCVNLFDMAEMLLMELPKTEMSNRALEMYDNRQNYVDIVRNQAEGKLVFNRIQYVVTERCSLRCRDCSHLIQYYKQPQDIDLEKYKPSFERLLEHVDAIAELRILGGEPFLNRDMGKLVEWYGNNDKIQSISIYTNGTIQPQETSLKVLQNKKVKVHISNYGIHEKQLLKTAEVFDAYHIPYFIRKYDAWQDAGGVEFRNYSIERKKEIFSKCFERNGFTFLKGRLYRCPRAAHAVNLKIMPEYSGDYVELMDGNVTREELKQQLKGLQDLTWLEGCNYCGGPDNHTQSIPAARQISQPVAYQAVVK